MGINCEICCIDDNPTEEQIVLFEKLICSMRDMPTEFLIFDFLNPKNGPKEQQGLVFCQMCREGNGIHVEIRIDMPDEIRMYASQMKEEEVTDLLRRMIRTRSAPDITEWEDITKRVFTESRDEDFE